MAANQSSWCDPADSPRANVVDSRRPRRHTQRRSSTRISPRSPTQPHRVAADVGVPRQRDGRLAGRERQRHRRLVLRRRAGDGRCSEALHVVAASRRTSAAPGTRRASRGPSGCRRRRSPDRAASSAGRDRLDGAVAQPPRVDLDAPQPADGARAQRLGRARGRSARTSSCAPAGRPGLPLGRAATDAVDESTDRAGTASRRGRASRARRPRASARRAARAACRCRRSRSRRRASRRERRRGVAKVAIDGDERRATARRSAVRSTTATIVASGLSAYPGQWPCSATSPKPTSAPFSMRRAGRARRRGSRSARAASSAIRMSGGWIAHARRVAHRDEPLVQAVLEEPDARLLRARRLRIGIDHEVEADEQAAAAHVGDRPAAPRDAAQPVEEHAADARRVLDEPLVEDRLDRHQRRGGRQRVAAVARRRGARQRERLGGHDRVGGDHGAHRIPRRHPLPHRHDVGRDAVVIAAEHPARAAEAGDHLVGDEERAVLARDRVHARQEAVGRHDVAGGALHRLDDDRGRPAARPCVSMTRAQRRDRRLGARLGRPVEARRDRRTARGGSPAAAARPRPSSRRRRAAARRPSCRGSRR